MLRDKMKRIVSFSIKELEGIFEAFEILLELK